MYNRYEYMTSNDCAKQSLARANSGLDWNYAIAQKIDRDLHDKLLVHDSKVLVQFSPVLSLIRSGYFWTARTVIADIELNDKLNEIKTWLATALTEADDTQENNTTVLLTE